MMITRKNYSFPLYTDSSISKSWYKNQNWIANYTFTIDLTPEEIPFDTKKKLGKRRYKIWYNLKKFCNVLIVV